MSCFFSFYHARLYVRACTCACVCVPTNYFNTFKKRLITIKCKQFSGPTFNNNNTLGSEYTHHTHMHACVNPRA